MSYEAEVLADNPALYLRLDETGTDTNGATWPDSSGNGLDATQVYSGATDPARGHDSPIETDGSSTEFYGWTNAAPEGLEGTSRLEVGSDALIEPAGDFAVEAWVRPMGQMFGATNIPLVGKKNSCGIMWAPDGGLQRFAGFCYDTAGTLWTVRDDSFQFSDFLETSFYIVVKRTANALTLWINATLRAVTNITSALGTRQTSDEFFVHPNVLNYQEARYDEVAFYTEALPDERIVAHFEAAQNNPPIVCRGDLHLVATLDGTDEPDPQLFPFSHNWETEVKETLSWFTDIIPAAQDYEQAAGIRQRPLRSFEFDYAILDERQQRKLDAFLFQNQRRTVYVRIETDTVQLTAAASAGASSLSFPAEHYDFDDDTLAALVDVDDETNFEIVTLDTVGNSSSTLAAITVNDWPAGTLVVPVRRALMKKEVDVRRHTDTIKDVSIVFDILAEDVALAPRRNGTYTPRYTHKDLEVFDPFILGTNNFNQEGRGSVTVRAVDPESPAGIRSRTPEDTASREIVSYSFFLDTRADIARFLAWKWSVQGRRVLLWVPTLQENFIPVSTAGSMPATLTVESHDYTDFYQAHDARRDLVLAYANETMTPKRITTAATSGANDVLTLEGVGAVSLANLLCVSFLKLSRLNEDTIGLTWHTQELLEVTINFIDLLTTP